MIHILTRDSRLRGRLALLLRELGHPAQFFDDIKGSVHATSDRPPHLLLVDVCGPASWSTVESPNGVPQVAVEAPEHLSPEAVRGRPANTDDYVLLPLQPHRAKERLRAAINKALVRLPAAPQPRRSSVTGMRTASPVHPTTSDTVKQSRLSPGLVRTIADLGSARKNLPPAETPLLKATTHTGTPPPARYLVAESEAMREFLAQLHAATAYPAALVFTGAEGAEFETAAREMNAIINDDRETLAFIPPDDFSIERLVQMERACREADRPRLCFLQHLEEIRAEPARQLTEIIHRLGRSSAPPLRLLIAMNTRQRFLDPIAGQVAKGFLKDLPHLPLPPLSHRRADIRPLALRLMSTLLEAHPFLVVREISPEALLFLEEKRHSLQFADIVSLLRNALALASRPVLGVAELQSFLDSDHTGRHLLESAADEHCFPSAGQAG